MITKITLYVLSVLLLLAGVLGGVFGSIVCIALACYYAITALIIDRKSPDEQKQIDELQANFTDRMTN